MINLFDTCRTYAEKWELTDERSFTQEEKNAVKSAVVVSSTYGNSVCFTMVSGGLTYKPLDANSNVGIGEEIDLDKAKILTLSKRGEEDIYRISVK